MQKFLKIKDKNKMSFDFGKTKQKKKSVFLKDYIVRIKEWNKKWS